MGVVNCHKELGIVHGDVRGGGEGERLLAASLRGTPLCAFTLRLSACRASVSATYLVGAHHCRAASLPGVLLQEQRIEGGASSLLPRLLEHVRLQRGAYVAYHRVKARPLHGRLRGSELFA